jgi:hypothetical protein
MNKKYQYEKHFTLNEARSYLPELRGSLIKIRNFVLLLKDVGFDIYQGKYKPGFHPDTFDEFPKAYRDMLAIIREITEKGIEIKGLEYGLVDFPAIRENGDEVFLCWKTDEDDIEFWHSLDGGFKGREHIDDF